MTRIAAGLAWTFSIAWAGNYVALLLGIPALAPAMIGVAVGAFVAMDPLHRIWQRSMPQPAAVLASQPTVEGLVRT